ncbi:MAG: hypothetical protein LBJ08_06285 [Bifidobacteriaceae bacterium]|jgi:hypothetical protein|nr:hypothetical protein [Bifidobacteriaceae bacterium]
MAIAVVDRIWGMVLVMRWRTELPFLEGLERAPLHLAENTVENRVVVNGAEPACRSQL